MTETFKFRAKLWLYDGPAGWHFVTLPKGLSKKIERLAYGRRSAYGSIRVHVSTGAHAWETSIFPDKKSTAYLLPIKADVRQKAGLAEGQTVHFELTITTG